MCCTRYFRPCDLSLKGQHCQAVPHPLPLPCLPNTHPDPYWSNLIPPAPPDWSRPLLLLLAPFSMTPPPLPPGFSHPHAPAPDALVSLQIPLWGCNTPIVSYVCMTAGWLPWGMSSCSMANPGMPGSFCCTLRQQTADAGVICCKVSYGNVSVSASAQNRNYFPDSLFAALSPQHPHS